MNTNIENKSTDRIAFSVALGARLREKREEKGLSQREFGLLGGVLKLAQMNYEKGVRVPSAEYLYSLSLHGIDVGYLVTGKPGEGSSLHPGVSHSMLTAALDTVRRLLKTIAPDASDEDFARCVVLVYSTFAIIGRDVTQETADDLGGLIVKTFFAGKNLSLGDGRK